MSDQGPTGNHFPWAPGSRELPQEINASFELIRQQAVESHEINVAAFRRQRKLLAGTLERCKELKKRVKTLLSTNRHLLQSNSRVRASLQAQIEKLEAEVLRLDRLAASRENENIDLSDEILGLQNVIDQGQACRLSLQEALETNLSGLQTRCLQLEDDHRARLADLEARNRTLQRQLDVRRRVPMADRSEPPARPGDAVSPPRWKGPVSWLVFIVLVLLTAFAVDVGANTPLWVTIEVILLLVLTVVLFFWFIPRLESYQDTTFYFLAGPGKSWGGTSTSALAEAQSQLSSAKADEQRVRADAAANQRHFESARADHEQKQRAFEAARRSWQDAVDAKRPDAEVANLLALREMAERSLAPARTTYEEIRHRQEELEDELTAAVARLDDAKANQPPKAWKTWRVRAFSLAIPLLIAFPLLWDGIDGNQLVRDGLAPRGYHLGWLSSEGQPAHRLSTDPDRRVRTSPYGVVVDFRIVPKANGGNVISVDGYRPDGKPFGTDLEVRVNDVLYKRR